MPYEPLRCPTCGSTKIITSENKRYFCISCEGWFVWKEEAVSKQAEPVSAPNLIEASAAPSKAHTAAPTTPAPNIQPTSPKVSRSSQPPEVITDWQTPAGYVAIGIGVLAFISSWLANGREATPFDGFLNPLFYIGVFLGWYWLNESKEIAGKTPSHQPSAFGFERQQELIRRQQQQSEALRKQKEHERQVAERRQRIVEEALRLQKERELREAQKQREQEELRKKQEQERAEKARLNVFEDPFSNSSSDLKLHEGAVFGVLLFGVILLLIIVTAIVDGMNSSLPAKNQVASKAKQEPKTSEEELSQERSERNSGNDQERPVPEIQKGDQANTVGSKSSRELPYTAERPPTPPKLIKGKVLNTNGSDFVTSLGSKDGLSVNDELEVFRNLNSGTYVRFLGKIKVVFVATDRSVGTFLSTNHNKAIRPGDDVQFQTR